ncbi:hypothetical protein PC9H_008240 [Pleurotus ostreatus]|uniref:Signal recognition particle subunit SRP72 n=1 Tax=Pleurotus ostreatus TaxID=5322 RepID=A0A8H7DSA3_PLEOS|nr:uncharacterized protein PC9H_008240 [Pleurotus ostreatus]KAF7429002.1 hypothetical protein PC9H_008240 [Pleurotus ostreatus]KAJ8697284.1 hypothetical protein PTI98_007077 [Pleurotus ostreatus]
MASKLPQTSSKPAKSSKVPSSVKKSKRGPSKQAIPASERLKRLFTSLCAQIDGGHFSNAIKTCDKILRLEPADPDARQTKLFLLLQTEQYDAALELIKSGKDENQYAFERTYSLYRLQREVEAVELLESLEEGGHRGVVHLEAQLNYRQGSYQAACDLYSQLLDTSDPHSEEHSDVLTNLQASQIHLDFINAVFLHVLGTLPSSLANSLESSPPPSQLAQSIKVSTPSTSMESPDVHVKDVPKKPRRSRVPVGVVPGVTPPPDPERWLKKSERSTFFQGRRRKTGAGGAT